MEICNEVAIFRDRDRHRRLQWNLALEGKTMSVGRRTRLIHGLKRNQEIIGLSRAVTGV